MSMPGEDGHAGNLNPPRVKHRYDGSGNSARPVRKPKRVVGVGRFAGRGYCPRCGQKKAVCKCSRED